MDTLISIGTLAAWGWSVVALLALSDARTSRSRRSSPLILVGRYLEARAKRRSGAAIRALLELGAKEAHVLRDGAEVSIAIEELRPGDVMVVRPGEDSHGRRRHRGRIRGRPVDADGRAGTRGREARVGCRRRDGQHVRTRRRPGDEGRRGDALAQIGRLVAERSPGKRPSSGSSTGSRACSSRSSSGCTRHDGRMAGRHRGRDCVFLRGGCGPDHRLRARSASRRPPRSWSAPVAARSSAS